MMPRRARSIRTLARLMRRHALGIAAYATAAALPVFVYWAMDTLTR